MKALLEKRNSVINDLEKIVNKASLETRAFTEEETKEYDDLKTEIAGLDKIIKAKEEQRSFEKMKPLANKNETKEEIEERAFVDYVYGVSMENRAGEQNINMGNNGAIFPTTIANKIIEAVKDKCPILAGATIYNVKGTLKVPVWGKANTTHDIAVGYQTEFTDIIADAGKFTSVDLGGYLVGALALIGKSVENNGSFSIVSFIVNKIAKDIAFFLEKELLNGTGINAATGALMATTTLTTASATAITTDELIELQSKVKQIYQSNSCWTMNPETFTAIRKLKDGNNRYLLQDDVAGEFPYRLLGKPVYISDNMPLATAANKAVLYGDYSGLSVNFRENIAVEVLKEKYATQHAIGVVAWCEVDSKITDNSKIAVLMMKAT